MRYRLLFGLFGAACLTLVAAPPDAAAQSGGSGTPVLRHAHVEVTPAPEQRTATVSESFTIDGVTAATAIRHLVTTFPGVEIDDLRVSVDSTIVSTTTAPGTGADTITFPAPHAGPLSYQITYTVSQQSGDQVPLLVPHVPTDGTRAVKLRYHVPEGYHVQGEPFPIVIGTSGTQDRDLVGVPSFLAYQLGRESSSGFGLWSWAGVMIIVLGVVCAAVVMMREARARKR